MSEHQHITLFEGQQVRYLWDEEKQQYFFSVVDVIQVLTDSPRPRKYWNDLKTRLEAEGSELSANIGQLKLPSSDGKKYLTDVATTEHELGGTVISSKRAINFTAPADELPLNDAED